MRKERRSVLRKISRAARWGVEEEVEKRNRDSKAEKQWQPYLSSFFSSRDLRLVTIAHAALGRVIHPRRGARGERAGRERETHGLCHMSDAVLGVVVEETATELSISAPRRRLLATKKF